MSESHKATSLDTLRSLRDDCLREGKFAPAKVYQNDLEEAGGDETAALSAGRTERLHGRIDDVDELQERQRRAENSGFEQLAVEYGERIDDLNDEADDEPSEAALEEQHRAALAEASAALQEQTRAALGSKDAIYVGDQPAAQYVYDTYGIDPRDFDDEYELREELAGREWQTNPKPQPEGTTEAEAALSIRDRNRIGRKDTTAAELIRKEYEIEPDEFDDVEELREEIRQAGGYTQKHNADPSRFSAFSDPDDWV